MKKYIWIIEVKFVNEDWKTLQLVFTREEGRRIIKQNKELQKIGWYGTTKFRLIKYVTER